MKNAFLIFLGMVVAGWAMSAPLSQADDNQADLRREAKANSPYALAVAPAKTVKAEVTLSIRAPALDAKEWILYAAQPPQLTQQKIRAAVVPEGKVVADLGNAKRELLLARVPVDDPAFKQQFVAKLQIDAQLFSRRLVPRQGNAKVADVPPLEGDERAAWLRETSLIDFSSEQFQQWMKGSRLVRVPGESQVDYARRVFLVIRKDFKYSYTSRMDRLASHVCRAGTSDCGGLAIVFVSALRANGVPARVLVGRWAASAKKGETVGEVAYYQQHVKAEFYADGVGWVPADLSSAVLHDKTPQGLQYFGNDKGDFITMHLDHDLQVDTFYFGKPSITWLQGITYWVSGSGSLDGVSSDENWQVR